MEVTWSRALAEEMERSGYIRETLRRQTEEKLDRNPRGTPGWMLVSFINRDKYDNEIIHSETHGIWLRSEGERKTGN